MVIVFTTPRHFVRSHASSFTSPFFFISFSTCFFLVCFGLPLSHNCLKNLFAAVNATRESLHALRYHRWSRGHKARGQGQEQTLSRPRPRTKEIGASVLRKKEDIQKFFSSSLKKKIFKKFFRRKRSSKNFFQAISTRGKQ